CLNFYQLIGLQVKSAADQAGRPRSPFLKRVLPKYALGVKMRDCELSNDLLNSSETFIPEPEAEQFLERGTDGQWRFTAEIYRDYFAGLELGRLIRIVAGSITEVAEIKAILQDCEDTEEDWSLVFRTVAGYLYHDDPSAKLSPLIDALRPRSSFLAM